jgi:hypothetical protein
MMLRKREASGEGRTTEPDRGEQLGVVGADRLGRSRWVQVRYCLLR